jgi:alpha-glucoside transport system substrate-binding protein
VSVLSISRSRRAALAVSAVLLVSACSSGATASPAASSQAPATSGPTGSAASPSASGGQVGGSVTVWTAWGGQELKAFQDVLKPFSAKTGIEVKLSTVRDVSQIAINVAAGTSLPDVGLPPTPDNVSDWATKGVMKPLDSVLDWADYSANTFPALTTCATTDCVGIYVVGGKHYAAFVKTQVKGLVWYNPKVFTGTAPKTWDELNAIAPPSGAKLWCAAFESGAASGWAGSDAIGNIVLRSTDPQHYMDWYNGKLKWSDPIIKNAYLKFGQMVSADHVYGGTNTVLTTNFGKAGIPLFKSPPGCLFLEQATFITNFFIDPKNGGDANLKAGTDFSFFAHPSIDPQYDGNIMGFADSLVMYNDTPQAQALMKYLVSVDAQGIWVGDGGTLAARKDVTNYQDPISKAAVDIVAKAKNILLTPGDQMPADMQGAFWKSVLDFTNDQSKLDSILAHLDEVQASAYKQ